MVFDSITCDAAGAQYAVLSHDSPIPSGDSNKWLRCSFENYTETGLRLYSSMPDYNIEKRFKRADLIACTFDDEPFVVLALLDAAAGRPAPLHPADAGLSF